MDVKTAIMNGDAEALRQLLSQDSSRVDELIRWGKCLTHPLHYVSDMLFNECVKKVGGRRMKSFEISGDS